jgi:hypothetical protein
MMSDAPFGSEAYIIEMDRILSDLDKMRRGMGRDERKERFTISKAIESIRYLQRKARRHGIKTGLLEDDGCK